MSLSKLDIEKFIIIGDYSLWKLKMRTLLIHQGLKSALEEKEKDLDSTTSSKPNEKKR